MKTNVKISMLAICMLFSGLLFSANTLAEAKSTTLENNLLINIPGSYSWNAVFGSIAYTVDLENVATKQQFKYETTATSISLGGVPSGTYKIVVKAKFADGSSIIIIEEIID